MQDNKLEELVNEVNRLNTIYNECEPEAAVAALLDLRAAEERLSLYLNERKRAR
ncbi:MAG: hypothetical protein RIN55_05750 [Tissierellaceae bacterium]|nr:hypothetical protein [Tissierellaceae bacterium]